MRRKDREMDCAFAWMVVDTCEYAVLSMTDREGDPYCVPVTIVREGEKIYFHCAKEGKKVSIIKKHPDVCMACVGSICRETDKFTTKYESAVVFGMAEEINSDSEKIHALRLLCERHTPANMKNFEEAIQKSLSQTAVFCISITAITGKCKR